MWPAHLDLPAAAREQLRRLIDTRETAELQRFLNGFSTSEGGLSSSATQLTGKREVLNAARAVITIPVR